MDGKIKMKLLSKITFGNILSLVSILGALIGIYVVMKSDIEVLKVQVRQVEKSQEQQHEETTNQINGVRLDLRAIYAAIISQSPRKKNTVNYEQGM